MLYMWIYINLELSKKFCKVIGLVNLRCLSDHEPQWLIGHRQDAYLVIFSVPNL